MAGRLKADRRAIQGISSVTAKSVSYVSLADNLDRQPPGATYGRDGPMIAPAIPRTREILIIDDEPHTLRILQFVLETAGYNVHTAPNGSLALEMLSGTAADADLVLLDLTMPRPCGVDLYDQIQIVRPGLPVVVCSGCCAHTPETNWVAEHGLRMIGKPFERRTLLKTVLDVIAREDDAPVGVGVPSHLWN